MPEDDIAVETEVESNCRYHTVRPSLNVDEGQR